MFIIKERYLEVPNFQNWTEGLYLVDAPCGTGKSCFVFHTLYPFAKENNKKLIVFSNRNALKRQQELQAEGTDIELITYQKLEYNQYLNGDWNVRRSVPDLMQELEGYDYIVLDEAHYLFQDARFNRNTEVILSMIERYRLSKVIIMLSATPDLLKSYFGDRIKETYEAEADYSYIQKAYCYTSKDAAYKILDSIPQNEKAVFFGDSRERLKELHRRYSDSAYLCSDNETTSDVFEQITSTERFACRFLFTTKVLDNGVNLTDRTIKHIIIEQTDLIDFIQCLGRKRVQDEEDTITLYFLRNISSIAARYGKLQKEIQLGNEYLFEREHDVDRFRKVHIKDKLPDFFDNAFGLIEPTWFKAKADYQFYYSLVGAKTPDKGKTTFAKEVSQRLKVRVHYYETVSKNYNLYSYLTKNVDRKYYNKDRKELIDTFGLRKDGHLLKSMGMFNQYLEENQIEYRLKSNKKNNKVYWTIVKTDENERNPLYRVTNDLKGEI